MSTPLRRLNDVAYWVIEDPALISGFINANIRREWEADARSEGRDPSSDSWLQDLSYRRWSLETVQITKVRLNPNTVEFVDDRRGYRFADSLAKRTVSLRTAIETYATVIWRSEEHTSELQSR